MIALIVISSSAVILSQQGKVEGKIYDKKSGKGLYDAALRIVGYPQASCTNSNGNFCFNPPAQNITFIASCLGYYSDTISLQSNDQKKFYNIFLTPEPKHSQSSLSLEIFTADEIVNSAISRAEYVKSHLKNYENDIYTRCVIRSNNDLGLAAGSFQVGFNKVKASTDFISHLGDDIPLRIKNIYESKETNYFISPHYYKEIITARNTNSGLPPSMSVLLGGKMFQNFYDNKLDYFDQSLPGPLSYKALSYYHFVLQDTLFMDNHPVYKIFLEPINKKDPGFTGFLYISADTFYLLKVDLSLNRTANIGGAFDNVNISQQWVPFNSDIYLPIDYNINTTVSYLLFASGSYELKSAISNYKINEPIDESIHNNAFLTIVPGCYKRDLSFWQNTQSVPYTTEELELSGKIDSMKSVPRGFLENTYSDVMAAQYDLNNNLFLSGPSGIYQFNHVEGHTLSLSFGSRHLIDNNLETKITVSNGFSDKRVKEKLSAVYYLSDLSTDKFTFNAYNKLATLFYASDSYSSLTSTVLALFSNHDFRNYYYTKGFDLKAEGEVLTFLSLNAGYSSHSDYSAVYHSNFSLFGLGRRNPNTTNNNIFSNSFANNGINPPVYEDYISSLNFGFNFDFRNFVEDNRLRKRDSRGKSYMTFGGGVLISDKKLLKSSIGFTTYNLNMQGELHTFRSASLGFRITSVYSNGPVPFQMQYSLPGNISGLGKNFTFRTIGLSNLFGDQAFTLNLEHNFREEILRLLPGRFFQNMNLQLTTFFNAAWKNMSPKSAAIMPVPFTVLNKPLLEAGFSIGHSIIPVGLEFAWRLTYVDRSSFRIGINTSIL